MQCINSPQELKMTGTAVKLSAAGHEVHRSFLSLSSTVTPPPDRRGRLKNGNPSGDFLAAPRCGARTRAGGCCRQPAMPNGRCRLHGGLSTGPRTAEGRARCARARRTHGGYTREITNLRRAARAHGRRVHALAALIRARPAGHGLLPTNSANRRHPAAQGRPVGFALGAQSRAAASVPASGPIATGPTRSLAVSAASRLRREPSIPAGHGLLPSFFCLAPLVQRLRRLWT